MRRVETGEHHVGEVPLGLFKGNAFKNKQYLEKAGEIVLDGVAALKIKKVEPIYVCSGYILSRARDELKKRGFKVSQRRIEGATQELAEREYIRSLVRLGVGDEEIVARMRSFNSFLGWVREDKRRERFVKTGWSAWPRLRREVEP